MRKRKLRLVLQLGPGGLSDLSMRLTRDKLKAIDVSGGEGSAFVFVLEDSDCSTNVAEGLKTGTFVDAMKNWRKVAAESDVEIMRKRNLQKMAAVKKDTGVN